MELHGVKELLERKDKQLGKAKAKKPTRSQKKWITAAGEKVEQWYVISETDDRLVLLHKETKEVKEIKKEV